MNFYRRCNWRAIVLSAALFAWFVFAPGAAEAAVRINSLIADGAVLQQGMVVPIWGHADAGEKVTVRFCGQEVSATAGADGRWMVRLQPLQPGGAFVMTVAGSNKLEVKDLYVGEVWVCAGQSNMAMQLFPTSNGKADSAAAAAPATRDALLRLCTVCPQNSAPEPMEDAELQWVGSENAGRFSAVGYYFGRDLRRELGVPVGLIHASVGSTAIGWWMNRQAFDLAPGTRQQIQSELGANTSKLYNSMIAPLQPYAIRGVIWYQGESDSATPERYLLMFKGLIRGWRQAWGEGDFPFLFVQAAPCKPWPPELREAQLLAWQQTPATAMVVSIDCGDPEEIHPPHKEPLGARLALAARAIAYGQKIEHSGPVFKEMKIDDGRAVLTFTHVGAGLVAKGGDLRGFALAGPDGKFVPATASIEKDQVVVRSPGITKPAAVRYAWAHVADGNLFNAEGLPATPFRTDAPAATTTAK